VTAGLGRRAIAGARCRTRARTMRLEVRLSEDDEKQRPSGEPDRREFSDEDREGDSPL
jgi:hypothetical protein